MGSEKISIAAVGAGRMGRGIALSFATAGHEVTLIDVKDRTSADFARLQEETFNDIQTDLAFLKKTGLLNDHQKTEISRRIKLLTIQEYADSPRAEMLIFEAVPEILEVKQETFRTLCALAPKEAIIASTTSTFLVDELIKFVTHPERFMNAHWLNPAHLMPLVEVSPSEQTSQNRVEELKNILTSIGKVPVVCAASPGYIVPRLQALIMNEAARMVEEGVATAEDIDKAVRVGFGVRYSILGLLEFIDWGGGDILYYASNYLADKIDTGRYTPPDIIHQNMENKKRGLKDGEGFYNYDKIDLDTYRAKRMSEFVAILNHMNLLPQIPDNDIDNLKE